MQVTQTLNEGLKRSYAIRLAAEELESKVTEKLEEARKDFQMKGFRKGKAPAALMKKMFGKSVMGEAMQELIDQAMRSHFETSGDRPALQPEVKMTTDDWKEGQDVEVQMTYEALPQVPELALADLKLEKLVAEIDDKAVDEALANLAASAKDYDDRKKGAKAKAEDQVVIDFKGSVDGAPFEGGAAEDFPLVLGSKSFIPGFEEQLVGAKAGDAAEVKVTFPESYGAKHLAGKEAIFAVTVKAVKAPKPAEINDALATRYGAEFARRAQGADPRPARRRVRPGQPADPEAPADGRARRAGELRPPPDAGRRGGAPDRPPALARGAPRPTRPRARRHLPDRGAPQARRAAGAAGPLAR